MEGSFRFKYHSPKQVDVMLSQLTDYAIKNDATDAKVVTTKDIAVEDHPFRTGFDWMMLVLFQYHVS
jgi:hypothetical protein